MSGHKLSTLRIQKSAAARLTRRRIKKILLSEEYQNRNARLREEHIADMDRVFHEMEARQSRFDGSLDGFQSHTLRQLEQENNAAMINSQTALHETMHALFNRMWLETDTILASETGQTQAKMAEVQNAQIEILTNQNINHQEHRRLSQQFAKNQQHIAKAFHDFESRQTQIADNQQLMFQQVQDIIQQQEERVRFQDSKEDIVHKQLADANSLYEFIIGTFNHEKFTPGEAQRAAYEMDKAHQNLDQGFVDAAMVNAQHVYQSLSEQRITLELKQAEWELLSLDVEKRLRQLLLDAEGLKKIPSTDLDGNEIGQMIDVDYWSSRRLSRLKTLIQNRLLQIDADAETLETEDLLTIQQQELPRLFEELENTCNLAIEEALNSQLRVNIADIVIQALENQGFQFSTSAYIQNDKRKAFSANVNNLAGDEIIIGVEPNKGEPGSNHLHLISADAEQRTEHELHQRAKEVLSTLNQFGLENGNIEVLSDIQQENSHQQKSTERNYREQNLFKR
jgi:hypothetical protein